MGSRAMAAFGRSWALVGGALVATVAAGCCTSMQRATAINAELEAKNRARAEPAMRSAAEQRGATLLPDRAYDLQLWPVCRTDHQHGCVLAAAEDGRTHRIRDDRGNERMAVPIGPYARSTARLARRGTKLLILVPQVTEMKVASRTQCECDGMPRIVSATGFVHIGFAFFVDEIPGVDIEEVPVRVTEEYIEWQCKRRLA